MGNSVGIEFINYTDCLWLVTSKTTTGTYEIYPHQQVTYKLDKGHKYLISEDSGLVDRHWFMVSSDGQLSMYYGELNDYNQLVNVQMTLKNSTQFVISQK